MKKLTKIWGIGLIVVMLVSLLVAAIPASAGTLSFTALSGSDVPSTTGKKMIGDGWGHRDMAVSADGQTIYVVSSDGTNGALYKSTNGGSSWSEVTVNSGITDINKVAMAPDDESIVVVSGDNATINNKTYLSTNGGSTWNYLNNTSDAITDGTDVLGTVNDIAISPPDGSSRYIAIAGADATDGCVFYFNYGAAAPTWKNAAGADFSNPASVAGITAFYAIAFSPNFSSDLVMTAIGGTTGATGTVKFNVASFNQKKWNADIFDGFPKTIKTATGNLTISAADISLDPNYLAGDDTTRIAMVGLAANDDGDTTPEIGGIFRLKNTALAELKADTAVNSVAWDGTNLAAGAYASNDVYRCSDALASSGWTVSTSSSNKEIGVTGTTDQVIVAWSGTDVVGVKQGNAAAFGKSTDNGKTWADISLISGTITSMLDIWTAPDGSVTYLITRDSGETSLWRQASDWTRVFCNTDTTNNYIVRAADSDPDVVYLATQGTSQRTIYYSTNGGVSKWTTRASRYDIADLAVQDESVAFVANNANDEVSKTSNGGFTWDSDKDTTADSGTCATITLIGEDQIIVGTTAGKVAYSSDGNSSWSKVKTTLNSASTVQVTASGLADGDYIYAATTSAGSRVERWEIGQSSDKWKNLSAPTDSSHSIYGIGMANGCLYAMSSNGTESDLLRTIEPTTGSPSAGKWSTITTTAAFNKTPSAMRLSAGSTIIWAISGTSLYTMTDTLNAALVVTLAAPAEGFQNPINPVNGNSQDISFSWNRPSAGTTALAYECKVYASDKTSLLITATKSATDMSTPNVLIGPNQGTNTLNFAPGETYYWKVRVSSPVYSPYSESRSFTIAPLGAQVPNVGSPANGTSITNDNPAFSWTPVANATKYEFQLALSPSFSNPITSMEVSATGVLPLVKLDAGSTYFWRVRAIEPVEGEWSTIANFMVAAPVEATPPVVVEQVPAPVINIPAAPPAQEIVIPPAPAVEQIAPTYIWAIIIIGAVLVIAVIILIVRTRRTV